MNKSEIETMLTSFEDQVRVWVETHEGEIQEIGRIGNHESTRTENILFSRGDAGTRC